eukprot:11502681-Alexandrium_andersonii.AAC.1
MPRSFQAGTALQEELQARVLQPQGLLADRCSPEPLGAAGNASVAQELRGKEVANRLQDGAGRGVAARESVRAKGGESEASGADEAEYE